MKIAEFFENIKAEDLPMASTIKFKYYSLLSNPLIKVILISTGGWDNCYIGFLINEHFHVLGLGSFAFINEDIKALYVALTCSLPEGELILKEQENAFLNVNEQNSITEKLKEILTIK